MSNYRVMVVGLGKRGKHHVTAFEENASFDVVGLCDIDEGKLLTARNAGAAETVNSARVDLHAALLDLTGGEGPDVVVEAIGLPATFLGAVSEVAFAGRVVYIGYAKERVQYETKLFVQKELDIRGSRNALRVFPAVVQMLEKRQQPFEELITRVYPVAQTAEALRDWDADPGALTKVLVEMVG